jgi:hypothetical protein
LRRVLIAAGALFAAACGGGGATSGFNPGVAGDKPINALTSAEHQTICDNVDTAFMSAAFVDEGCRAQAIGLVAEFDDSATDAQLPSACASAYAACEKQKTGADAGASETCTPPATTCEATVDQLTACINEFLTAVRALDLPACSELTRAKLEAIEAAPSIDLMAGPACQAYATACPDDSISSMVSALSLSRQ